MSGVRMPNNIMSMLDNIEKMLGQMSHGAGTAGAGQFQQQMRSYGGGFPGSGGMGGMPSDGSEDEDMFPGEGQPTQWGGHDPQGQGAPEAGGGSKIENLMNIIEQLKNLLQGMSQQGGQQGGMPGAAPSGGTAGGMPSSYGMPDDDDTDPSDDDTDTPPVAPTAPPLAANVQPTSSAPVSASAGTTSVGSTGGTAGSASGATTASSPAAQGLSFLKNGKEGGAVGGSDGNTVAGQNVSWYYNWGSTTSASQGNGKAQFIPMIWGQGAMSNLSDIKNSTAPAVLTFNEPDLSSQANMSVSQALQDWPAIEQAAQGKEIGAPAVSGGGDSAPNGVLSSSSPAATWLQPFLQQAKQQGLKVDFLPLHWYGSSSESPQQNVSDMMNYVNAVEKMATQAYGKPLPIALTEFGVDPNGDSAGSDPQFLKLAEQALNADPNVMMYSTYGAGTPGGNS